MAKGDRIILVMLESLATGHKITRTRARLAEKLEILFKDPWVNQTVLYRETKKLRTVKK